MQKLTDLREAWVNYTRPAVSATAKKLLQQRCADLVIPDTALDLAALQDVVDKCKSHENPGRTTSNTCTEKIIELISKEEIEDLLFSK